jgi:hypothetical protein
MENLDFDRRKAG